MNIVRVDGELGQSEVKDAALTTIHKKSIEGKEISSEWKNNIIMSRHSPIREYNIRIKLDNIPRWIADQLVRHSVGVNNYMGTMRTDRKNLPRKDQTMEDLTVFKQTYNINSFIDMCSTRMCIGCVSKETRLLVEKIVAEVRKIEPEIALFCVPPCIRYFGCKEAGFTKCNHFNNFIDDIFEDYDIVDIIKLDYRNKLYHEYRGREDENQNRVCK